jgi:hypothetical protein
MENEKKSSLCKASVVIGVIATAFALLPLLSAWLMFLSTINYLLVPAGIICGIIALVKGQDTVKAIVGIVLSVLAITLPLVLAEYYLASAADSVGNMLDIIGELQ